VYRWRQQLGRSLCVFPSFSLSALGLLHIHLIVHRPGALWLRFPYAVEHAWLTADFLENALYLHCLVPAMHEEEFRALVASLQQGGSCRSATIIVSDGARQELRLTGERTRADVAPAFVCASGAALLRDQPLVVPVIAESWGGQQSFAETWTRVVQRDEKRLRSYVPHGKIYATNGKAHIKDAWDTLERAGLFEQYVVRYDGLLGSNVEVFLVLRKSRDWLPELLEALRPVARVIESYGDEHGGALVRAIGSRDLLDALLGCQAELVRHAAGVYVRNTHEQHAGSVRFCYDFLFNPKTGSWEFPRERILEHLEVRQ